MKPVLRVMSGPEPRGGGESCRNGARISGRRDNPKVRKTALRPLSWLAAALAAAALGACATPPPASDPDALAEFRANNDPLEPTNRVFYVIDDKLDTYVLRPVTMAYRAALPDAVRNSVHNALTNLGSPVRLANDMAQGSPRRAGDSAMRFLINSTAGVGGFFDVAAKLGYPAHETDMGITLALKDVPEGAYLFLPFIGPGNLRDTGGWAVDTAADPFIWVGQGTAVRALRWSRVALKGIDFRDRHGDDIDSTRKTALDPYATFRSVYRQLRKNEVRETRADNQATIPIWFPQKPVKTSP